MYIFSIIPGKKLLLDRKFWTDFDDDFIYHEDMEDSPLYILPKNMFLANVLQFLYNYTEKYKKSAIDKIQKK